MNRMRLLGFAAAAVCSFVSARAADGETVKGAVKVTGEVPRMMKPLKIDMSSNADCQQHAGGKAILSDDAVIADPQGGLKNVFVYVKSGLPKDAKFAPPKEPVKLDQESCVYQPHVFGIMVGQELKISNSDPTLHNIHSKSLKNKEINKPQPAKAPEIVQKFTTQEVFVEFKCDVHPWMKAYAGVVAHPFWAVTKEDGSFEIQGLPAGEYEFEAKHPKLGSQVKKVKVESGKPPAVDFSFEPAKKKN